ncbi:FxsA family protein [Thalassotalea profundi]|uniref:Membrane protein FxsA n=1 Tax=Thalassotalea profundi TaxID=2036687 RepID=A0ABQ3J0V5_9GAMM|nr:FxsA family protein [Thalassotalea profundi]GHF00753.1 membrane protein FxsA [Thalassotalea profundi]
MFRVLFLLFILIPIIEISVLMQVGAWFGLWPTIAIVIITAWLGAKYVKQQGLATLQSVQNKMAQGEMPSDEIVEGLLLLVAGVVLVTPGFVTDIVGLLLLLPPIRQGIVKKVQKHMVINSVAASTADYHHSSFVDPTEEQHINHHQGKTIDGEYERKE